MRKAAKNIFPSVPLNFCFQFDSRSRTEDEIGVDELHEVDIPEDVKDALDNDMVEEERAIAAATANSDLC